MPYDIFREMPKSQLQYTMNQFPSFLLSYLFIINSAFYASCVFTVLQFLFLGICWLNCLNQFSLCPPASAFNVVMGLAHKILIYTTYSTFVLDFLTFPVVFVSDVFLVLLLSIHTLWCQFVFITHFLSQMILIYQRFCN